MMWSIAYKFQNCCSKKCYHWPHPQEATTDKRQFHYRDLHTCEPREAGKEGKKR